MLLTILTLVAISHTALRNCSIEVREKLGYREGGFFFYLFFCFFFFLAGKNRQLTIKGSLIITKNRQLKLMILVLFFCV